MQQNALGTIPVVILAGGLGTRLRPVLADRPKGLAPIGERPFLEIQVDLLRRQGARRFVFSIGHLAQQIQDHFGDGRRFGVKIAYSVEGPQLLGTGGALKLAERFFTPRALVLNGDTFFDLDYAQLLTRHEEEQAAATLALARADDGQRYGRVVVDPSSRRAVGFQEKDPAKIARPEIVPASPDPGPLPEGEAASWLNAGAYVIQCELLAELIPGEPYSLERDVFPAALRLGRKLAVLTSQQRFFDIGTPGGWRQFAEYHAALPAGGRTADACRARCTGDVMSSQVTIPRLPRG
jgi:NDP-sugar pyrophosphorylase family protein